MCEKLWKWKFFMYFLTIFYVSVLTSVSADYAIVISVLASVSADMKIRYIGGYRYRPIWKSDISVVIGIGRYEKMLIGRPLVLPLYKEYMSYVLLY